MISVTAATAATASSKVRGVSARRVRRRRRRSAERRGPPPPNRRRRRRPPLPPQPPKPLPRGSRREMRTGSTGSRGNTTERKTRRSLRPRSDPARANKDGVSYERNKKKGKTRLCRPRRARRRAWTRSSRAWVSWCRVRRATDHLCEPLWSLRLRSPPPPGPPRARGPRADQALRVRG